MTMIREQESPIPSNKTLEQRNEMESPLSEEIRQRAARWRKMRESCPELTMMGSDVDLDGSDPGTSSTSNTTGTPPPTAQQEQQQPPAAAAAAAVTVAAGEQQQQQQRRQTQHKSRRKSSSRTTSTTSGTMNDSSNDEKSFTSSPSKSSTKKKKSGTRLRYSDMMNSRLGESWQQPSTRTTSSLLHFEEEEGGVEEMDGEAKKSTTAAEAGSSSNNNNKSVVGRRMNRRQLMRKTHSVPSFATDDTERTRPSTSRNNKSSRSKKGSRRLTYSDDSNDSNDDLEDGNNNNNNRLPVEVSRSKSGLESNLRRITDHKKKGSSSKKNYLTDEATIGDDTIDDSSRPNSEVRTTSAAAAAAAVNKANATELPRSKLDDFLDALIHDARKTTTTTKIDGDTKSQSKPPPRRSRSSRQHNSIGDGEGLVEDVWKSLSARSTSTSGKAVVTATIVSTQALPHHDNDHDEDNERRPQQDPPQIIERKKSYTEKPSASNNRGKDPPGKVKKTKNAVPLGGFLDNRRKNKDGRPTGAATVAGDRVASRLTGIDEKTTTTTTSSSSNKGTKILDALLSPRKGSNASSVRRSSPLVHDTIDGKLQKTRRTNSLQRAASMSVVGRNRAGTDLISSILGADANKATTTTGGSSGPALGSFLDRRTVSHNRKSGANTVAGDRVAIRASHSMNRTTREVLERLEADEKGASMRKFSESMSNIGTTTTIGSPERRVRPSSKGDSWRPSRVVSDTGVDNSGEDRQVRLQNLQSAMAIQSTASGGNDESDIILDSARIFDRSAHSVAAAAAASDGEEAPAFNPHNSTGNLDLGGFLGRKNARSLKSRKKSGTQSVGGDRSRQTKKKSKSKLQLEDSTGETTASVSRRPRKNSDAADPEVSSATTTSKPTSRRKLMKKMLSSPALGRQNDDEEEGESGIVAIKKKSIPPSPRRSTLRQAVGDGKLGSQEIFVRADGKKVRRVHRKPVDGEILTRPDGTKVRVKKLSKGKKAADGTRKSWLDQYLDGEEVPIASGHSRPVPRTESGTMRGLVGRTASMRNSLESEAASGPEPVRAPSLQSVRHSKTISTPDKKSLSLRNLRDNDANVTSDSKPLSLRSVLTNSDTGTESGGEETPSAKRVPATPLSTRERRKMFHKMNSVPTLAASPLVNLYDKKKNDTKERGFRRPPLSEPVAPDSPRKEIPTTDSDSEPKRNRSSGPKKSRAGKMHSLTLLDLSDKSTVAEKEPKRPDSDRAITYTSRSSDEAELDKTKVQENNLSQRPPTKASSPEDKKRQLLRNSDMLRKAQSLSNLGHRQYDVADRLMLVERLRSLKNDAGVAGLRPKPKGDSEHIPDGKDTSIEKSMAVDPKIDSSGKKKDSLSMKFERLEAKVAESASPGTLRAKLRKVSSQSDISSITEMSKAASKPRQFSRWTSAPKEVETEPPLKSPKRNIGGSDATPGIAERQYFLKNAIPSIELDSDVLDDAPARPSSARTMNSGSGHLGSSRTLNSGGASPGFVRTSNRTLNSEAGSKKEAPPGQPTRKQSLLPGTGKNDQGEPDVADNEKDLPSMPRRKLSTQPKTSSELPPRGTSGAPSKLPNVVENPTAEVRPSLLTLGPPESPFRRSLARWSSVPKDLGSLVNDSPMPKHERIRVADIRASDKVGAQETSEKIAPAKKTRTKLKDEPVTKTSGKSAQLPAPGSQLIVFDDDISVCSDITDCWTHESMSNWLAAETRRRATGHNRRGSYDLGSIIKEEGGAPAPTAAIGAKFEDQQSPLQRNRWDSSTNLAKEIEESLPHPKRPIDAPEPKREETSKETSNRFGWLKKFSFPRVKVTIGKNDSDGRELLNTQSDDEL